MKKREEVYYKEKREPITSEASTYRGKNPDPILKRTLISYPRCKDGTLIIIWGKKGTTGKCPKCGTPATANPRKKGNTMNKRDERLLTGNVTCIDCGKRIPYREAARVKWHDRVAFKCQDCLYPTRVSRALAPTIAFNPKNPQMKWHNRRFNELNELSNKFPNDLELRGQFSEEAIAITKNWARNPIRCPECRTPIEGRGRAARCPVCSANVYGRITRLNPVGSYSIRLRCPKCARSIEPTTQISKGNGIELRGRCPNCNRMVGELVKRNPNAAYHKSMAKSYAIGSKVGGREGDIQKVLAQENTAYSLMNSKGIPFKNPPESWHKMRRKTLLEKMRYYEDIGDNAKADAYNIAIEEEDIALNQRTRNPHKDLCICNHRKVQKLGSIYFVNGLRVEGVDYDNGKWHWSDKVGWYTHSLPEAIKSGYEVAA